VLIDKAYKKRGKKQAAKQEWITAIECISATGVALPPSLFSKGKI
jgi:hypothetical protein